MKLWVDDIRNAPDDSWNVARTVGAAIRAIAMFGDDIKEISLDHDISHQVTIGTLGRPYPCDETFQAVAHYIALRYGGTIGYPHITLHTSNPVGAADMKSILNNAKILCDVKMTGIANRLELEV